MVSLVARHVFAPVAQKLFRCEHGVLTSRTCAPSLTLLRIEIFPAKCIIYDKWPSSYKPAEFTATNSKQFFCSNGIALEEFNIATGFVTWCVKLFMCWTFLFTAERGYTTQRTVESCKPTGISRIFFASIQDWRVERILVQLYLRRQCVPASQYSETIYVCFKKKMKLLASTWSGDGFNVKWGRPTLQTANDLLQESFSERIVRRGLWPPRSPDLDRLVEWLWWGETDVSELRPLQAYSLTPADRDVDHGMMVSTAANS
jgi:hypothetical protein